MKISHAYHDCMWDGMHLDTAIRMFQGLKKKHGGKAPLHFHIQIAGNGAIAVTVEEERPMRSIATAPPTKKKTTKKKVSRKKS